MARRGARPVSLTDAAGRYAISIVLDAAAFIVCNVGTRPPVQLLADIVHSLRAPLRFVRGVLRAAIGVMLLLLAARFIAPTVGSNTAFSIVETWSLFAALAVEWLVGEHLRRAATRLPETE